MHDLDDRAPPEQVRLTGVFTDLLEARARGVLAHLITDRVAEILGDMELVGRVPGARRRHLRRAIRLVLDPRPPDGDLTKGRLEGEGSCPPKPDARAAFALPLLEDQFVVGFLDEDLEEPALDVQARVMDERLDLVGEMLVLVGHGQGHLQLELQGEPLILAVDGTEGDGSLKVVDVTHGGSPYWHYGGPSCVFFVVPPGKVTLPGRNGSGRNLSYPVHPPLVAHQLASRWQIFLALASWCAMRGWIHKMG